MTPYKTLSLFIAFITASANPDALAGRHAVITAGLPVDQLFAGNYLAIREGNTCLHTTETLCADGTGCCPRGDPCIWKTASGTSYPACGGSCPLGAVTCAGDLCCLHLNEVCLANGLCGPATSAEAPASTLPVFTNASSVTSTSSRLPASTTSDADQTSSQQDDSGITTPSDSTPAPTPLLPASTDFSGSTTSADSTSSETTAASSTSASTIAGSSDATRISAYGLLFAALMTLICGLN